LAAHHFAHVMVPPGQNSTPELREFIFRDLQLRRPNYELDIDTSGYGAEVADVIRKSDELFKKEKPDALLVLGDTYSGLSVLPAAHYGIKIFHMEAGLRAWDRRMPEQRNRILIDHISNILLPYNQYHRENLLREGIHPSKIIVTGNTTFEAMRAFAPQVSASNILDRLKLEARKYFLVTAHRSENVDNPVYLNNILNAMARLALHFDFKVIFPMHPRTKSKLRNLAVPSNVEVMSPLGFYDFNSLLCHAFCVVSDSGTAAEEGLFYKVPNVSLRMATERMETIESGATIVSGMDVDNIVASVVTATSEPWNARYELEEEGSPSNVVINALRTQITNFF
ncbi:MAG: non-hydrolyzing UDP-N-acetylglucosamine 2-epimerase, partial [Xanthobacteraceae bacterium]